MRNATVAMTINGAAIIQNGCNHQIVARGSKGGLVESLENMGIGEDMMQQKRSRSSRHNAEMRTGSWLDTLLAE